MAHETDMCEDDAEALRVRRADLYAFMQEVTTAALRLPKPETYIEAERAVRTIATADRLIQSFDQAWPEDVIPATPPTPAAMRKALRGLADHVMAAVKTLPMPDNAITALHALRYAKAYDRMLTQLYAPPKPSSPKPKPAPSVEPAAPPRSRAEVEAEISALVADIKRKVAPRLAQMKEDARKSGFWYDGRPYIPEPEQEPEPEPERREPPKPEATAEGSVKATETPAAETENLNPRPQTSEGQHGNNNGQIPTQPDPP